jgi:hypothetical protein
LRTAEFSVQQALALLVSKTINYET